jgi:hypothetical protein
MDQLACTVQLHGRVLTALHGFLVDANREETITVCLLEHGRLEFQRIPYAAIHARDPSLKPNPLRCVYMPACLTFPSLAFS